MKERDSGGVSETGISKGKTINKKRAYVWTDGRSAQGIDMASRGWDERDNEVATWGAGCGDATRGTRQRRRPGAGRVGCGDAGLGCGDAKGRT